MKIGAIVKEYRQRKKLTMEEFANKIGKSKGYISMLEKGENPQTHKPIAPTFETLKEIAKAMDLDINVLIKQLDGEQFFEATPVRYDWDDEERNLKNWRTFDHEGNFSPSVFDEGIFSDIKNTLSDIQEITFTKGDIEAFYSSCVIDGTTIKDRETLIKYLQKTVEDYDALLNSISDQDKPPMNSGLLSVLVKSRNNYKYYLEKLEA